MIYYLVNTGHGRHTIQLFAEHWAGAFATRLSVIHYSDLFKAHELPLGTYIFSDIERLLPAETEAALMVWNRLDDAGARLLNHPALTLRRFDLLDRMYSLGQNRFRVIRATDRTTPLRYPVFVREENNHSGSLTRLLNSRQEVDEALAGAVVRGHLIENLMVVEYCDTSDAAGVFSKYSAFKLGDRIIPGFVDCSLQWVVKGTDIEVATVLEEERRYLREDPHHDWIEEVFAIARTDFGRIDYGFTGDRPQVWEINTNPAIIQHPDEYEDEHLPIKRRLVADIVSAFEALDCGPSGRVDLEVPAALRDRMDRERRVVEQSRMRRRRMRRLQGSRAFRAVRAMTHPFLRTLSPLLTRSRPGRK